MKYCLLFSDPFLSERKYDISDINLIDFGCHNHRKTVKRFLRTIKVKYFLLQSDDAKFVLKRKFASVIKKMFPEIAEASSLYADTKSS